MRHQKKFNHLGRKKGHREAMLANMASSLVKHKRINTTVAKAKALRVFVEPLITRSKLDTTHSRRIVFKYLRDKYAVTELFREVAPKIAERKGGYTRILKTGNRLGDNAEMCFIELVDFNDNMLKEPKVTKEKTKRTRRGGRKKPQERKEIKSEKKTGKSKKELSETPVDKSTDVVEPPTSKKEKTPEAKEEKPKENKEDSKSE